MLAAIARIEEINRVIGLISTEKCRDRNYRIIYLEDKVAIPIKEDCVEKFSSYRNRIYMEIMNIADVPPRRKRIRSIYELEEIYGLEFPKSFNEIGDIILINEPPNKSETYLKKLGEILREEFGVRAVFVKEKEVSGEIRVAEWKRISGFGGPKTVYRENNLYLVIDFSKVFFNPRLGQERLRIFNKAKPGEKILDLFTGVGPFAILLAKKVDKVVGFDINCHAIELANLNALLNRVSNNVEFICDDARNAPNYVDRIFDRIIMNFPERSLDFLDVALRLAKDESEIHLYIFVRSKNKKLAAEDSQKVIENELKKFKTSFEIKFTKSISEVAPRKYMVVADIIINADEK